jgi:hypothetical protein
MREIKFRFWVEKAQKMSDFETAKKECDRLSLLSFEGFIPMQYVGLNDIDGKHIYENDILEPTDGLPLTGHLKPHHSKLASNNKYKVCFGDGKFYITKSNSARKHNLSSLLIRMNGLKIIGNTFENRDINLKKTE